MFSSNISRLSINVRKLCTVNRLKSNSIISNIRSFCHATDNLKNEKEATFANLLRHSNLMHVSFTVKLLINSFAV